MNGRFPIKGSTESEAHIGCRVRLLDRIPDIRLDECEEAFSIFCLPVSLGTNWWSQAYVSTSHHVRVHLCGRAEQSLALTSRSTERFRTEHASFPFSSLKPGESWPRVSGEKREGREGGHGPSHAPFHSWVLIKEENTGSDVLDLQDPNVFWLFRRAKGSGFTGTIPRRTSNSKPKAAASRYLNAQRVHLAKVTLRWLWVAQQHDVSLLMGAGLLSNATWKREVAHRNLSNSSKNFISLKIFNIFLYVTQAFQTLD